MEVHVNTEKRLDEFFAVFGLRPDERQRETAREAAQRIVDQLEWCAGCGYMPAACQCPDGFHPETK